MNSKEDRARLSKVDKFDRIVCDYIEKIRDCFANSLAYFEDSDSIEQAIEKASISLTKNGKKHGHQQLIPNRILSQANARLQRSKSKIHLCNTFQDLYDLVSEEIGPMEGIGRLAVYDISLRIGRYLGLEPKLVYLQRGAALGARYLGFKGDHINPSDLPEPFRRLSPAEIEDCLCVYKDDIREVTRGK